MKNQRQLGIPGRSQKFVIGRWRRAGRWLGALAILAAAAPAHPSTRPGGHSIVPGDCTSTGFLPENRIRISTFSASANGMTEQRFNEIIDRVGSFYQSVVSQRGGTLVFERNWNDGTVNAYAKRNGNSWIVSMFGGLARHPDITDDGFNLVVCHEMGHHLGGVPKYRGQWAANEGQADYFATLKCLRNVWQNDNNVEIVRHLQIDATVTAKCEKSFGDANSIAICARSAVAGLSTANLVRDLAGSGPMPNFNTPDPSVVNDTFDQHPQAQCRLDTYFGGAICQVDKSEPLSETNPSVGTCSTETGARFGYRPLCWYKPNGVSPDPNPTSPPLPPGVARQPTIGGQTQIAVHDPYAQIFVDYDVSEFQAVGAAGVYFEISAPNREFNPPNGVSPDPNHFGGATQRGLRGRFWISPIQHLPGWGTYSLRVIPLDGQGTSAVGRFSNSSKILLSS